MAASKSDRERASRLRARAKRGELGARDAKWLERYESERGRVARKVARNVEPPEDVPASEPAAAPESAAAPSAEPEMVEIAGEVEPAAAGPTPPQGAPPSPGAPFGPPPGVPGAPGGPLPTLHQVPCPVGPDCPGCAGTLDATPKLCVRTGREVYPALSDEEAEGWAVIVLEGLGAIVRTVAAWFFGRKLRAIDPSPLELTRLTRAIRLAARRRSSIGWLGSSFGDLAALVGVGQAYVRRAWSATPAALPEGGAVAAGD